MKYKILYLVFFTLIARGEDWDTLSLFSSPFPLGKVLITRKLKGEMDDTARIFFSDTSFAYLLTDTARFYPIKLRAEVLGRIGRGYSLVDAGDLDGDGREDLILTRNIPPYNILRFYWSGAFWQREEIGQAGEMIYDLTVGDCDNDGKKEILLGGYNSLKICRFTISGWEVVPILTNTGEIKGVTIGNFDPTASGREIGATFSGGKVKRIHWNGREWDTVTIFSNSNLSLGKILSGDFDRASFGEEICVVNRRQPQTFGCLYEIYYSGGFASRIIFRPTGEPTYTDLSIGNFYDANPGNELVAVTDYGLPNHCRIVYGSGNNWQNAVIFSVGERVFYGVKVGDANRHRLYNEEILTTVSQRLYLLQQYKPYPPVITNISQPPFPLPGETLRISCKIYTPNDSLRYISDTLYFSRRGSTFYPVLKDTFSEADSIFFYTIPPGDSGERFFYYIKAFNRFGRFSQSPTKTLNIGLIRQIREIQYTTDPQGRSPDTNKWVITTGVVSGIFRNNFFVEERELPSWKGIFITSDLPPPQTGDSVKISGRVLEINNLTTIRMSFDSGSSIVIYRRGIPLLPQLVRIPEITESLEGVLGKLDTLHFKARGFFEGNQEYWAYSLSESESILVRIEEATNIPGMVIPETPFMITGNIAQSGFNFQILPRCRNDFLIYPPGIKEMGSGFVHQREKDRQTIELFDALGRKVRGNRLSGGVYLIKKKGGYKVVIIRNLRLH